METRPAPPRIRRIAVTLLSVSLGGLMLGLFIAPPAAFAPYQPWFPFAMFAIDIFFGLWLLSCNLFFHARFAKAIGTGQNSPLVPWLGPKRARLFFLLVGLFLLTVGVVNLLLEWFVR